jgi:hypothetical protein
MAFDFLKTGTVYRSLVRGLDEMERRGADRVILTVYEDEPSTTMQGKWTPDSKPNTIDYYPFEVLGDAEQEMVRGGKHYTVVALVSQKVGGLVEYRDRGVERYRRTRIRPFLPRLRPESNLSFVTEGGVFTGPSIKEFAKSAANDGWTPELIEKRVSLGINEYCAKTKELMEKAGVYAALQEMEQKNTPFEQIMIEMRSRLVK